MTDDTSTSGSVEHERHVVGAIMLDANIVDDVTDVIDAGDFYDARLARIFTAEVDLHERGAPVDAVSVADELTRSGDLEKVGGRATVHGLVAGVPLSGAAGWHAQRIRDASTVRQVWRAGSRLQELAGGGASTEDEALAAVDQARSELDAVSTRSVVDVPNSQAVWDAIKALDDPPGDPTPWQPITTAIAGWKPGALYVFGARPAVGKSVAAVMAAVGMATQGKSAALFSLEMSKNEVYHRMLVADGGVDMGHLQARRLSAGELERLNGAAARIAGLPLVVSDTPGLSVAQIRARVRAEQRRGPVGLVVVDHLGLLRAPSGAARQDRRVQVDAIARSLKELAMELRVPVLALAQLNRASTARSDGMPMLSDLRESGEIEQSADVVFLMHRDLSDPELSTVLHVMAAKNRHGPLAKFEFNFRGHLSRFDP